MRLLIKNKTKEKMSYIKKMTALIFLLPYIVGREETGAVLQIIRRKRCLETGHHKFDSIAKNWFIKSDIDINLALIENLTPLEQDVYRKFAPLYERLYLEALL